jgi:geranylgeranyl diphosphate synthase type II
VDAEDLLKRYQRRAAEEIERRLPRGEPRAWLYEPMADYPRRAGKGLRAALCLATCQAYGGTEDDALAVAAAIELAHCAFLIHDDIEDSSPTRRGRSTLHRREGIPIALNAGDGLAVLSLAVLRDGCRTFGPRLGARVFDEFLSAMVRTLEGQALELGWRRDGVVDLSSGDYLSMVLGKTCWYTTIAPMRIGALIGSRGSADLAAVSRFGLFLGTAFQITDDILNLTGGQADYGKEIHGDLREGKRTLMLIHLLSTAAPDDRAVLVDLLHKDDSQRTDEQLRWLADLLVRYGSIAFARDFACGVADAAADAFSDAFHTATRPEEAEVVRHLVRYAIERSH